MVQVTLTERAPMVFPFVPLERSILGKFKISSECSGIIRKLQGKQAVKKSNLHLSAGTVQLTQQANKGQREAAGSMQTVTPQTVPCFAVYVGWSAPNPSCTLLWPLPAASSPSQHAPDSQAEQSAPNLILGTRAFPLLPGREFIDNLIWKHNSLQQETLRDCICSPGYSRQAVIYSKAPDPVLKPCLDDFMGSEAEVSYLQ